MFKKNSRTLSRLSQLIKDKPDAVVNRVESMMRTLKNLEKEAAQLKTKMAEMQAEGGEEADEQINGITTVIRQVTVDQPSALRELADRFKDRVGSGIVVLGCETDGKALLIVVVTKDLIQRFHAGKMIKEIARVVGGGAAAEGPIWPKPVEPNLKN